MLEIANLSHTYANGTVALDNVSLSIPRGMFGLLGPNGAGKSTLMRTVATLQEPTAGTIKFGEIDVLAQPGELRKRLGYLPQDFGVYPRVSAYSMLDQLAVLKGITGKGDRKSIVDYLRRGLAYPANGMMPRESWVYEPALPAYDYDPAKARALLDEAGYRDPDGDGPAMRMRLGICWFASLLVAAVIDWSRRDTRIRRSLRNAPLPRVAVNRSLRTGS